MLSCALKIKLCTRQAIPIFKSIILGATMPLTTFSRQINSERFAATLLKLFLPRNFGISDSRSLQPLIESWKEELSNQRRSHRMILPLFEAALAKFHCFLKRNRVCAQQPAAGERPCVVQGIEPCVGRAKVPSKFN